MKTNKKEKNRKENSPMTMSDGQIRQLAEDIYRGYVFIDTYIHNAEELPMVFMPFALMDSQHLNEIKDDIGMIYEYYEKAGPMSINGMPMFVSCRILNKIDTQRLYNQLVEIRKAVENIVKSGPIEDFDGQNTEKIYNEIKKRQKYAESIILKGGDEIGK